MSWNACAYVSLAVLGGRSLSLAILAIPALAALIFVYCAGTASHTDFAQTPSLGSGPPPSLPHPVSAVISTAPPDRAAASFLFTGSVPSMALGPRNLHGGPRPSTRPKPYKQTL